ncbi:MAG TPA: NAD-dependent epimerase/dehydratase family protein [Streptosporangiaceae bacterium]|nr:NAD-dependent epimerase/dehydratase family protein [Streptosporangiaceae bacterium]
MTRVFRRAVVTGGAGFVGAHVCRRLLEAGTAVVCLDNLLTGSTELVKRLHSWPGFEYRNCDVTVPFDVAGDVDLVLHLASPASPTAYGRFPMQTLEAGSLGTRHALRFAERAGARFVLASTSEVYGDPEQTPQPETYWGHVNPVGPRSVYDEAKRFAEAMTAAYSSTGRVDAAIARIFNSYGPGMRADDGRMVPTFACQALRGEPLTVTGDGSQTRSLCHVSDTVHGLLLLAASDLAGPVNIGNPDEATVNEIAARIIALAKSSSRIRYVPRPEDDPMSRCPDLSLARSALGFEPRISWQQGLTETLDWFARFVRPAAPAASVPAGRW